MITSNRQVNGHFGFWTTATLVLLLCLFSIRADAQTNLVGSDETAENENVHLDSPEGIREMVSRLSDNEVRDLLLQHLDAAAETESQGEPTSFASFLNTSLQNIVGAVEDAVERLPVLWEGQSTSFRNFASTRGPGGVVYFIGAILLAVFCGLIAEWVIDKFAAKWRERIAQTTNTENLRETLAVLGLRLLLDVIGLIAFFIIASLVLHFMITNEVDKPLVGVITLNMIVFPRLMSALSRFLLAPKRPELRLVYTDDESAKFIHRHLVGLIILMGFNVTIIHFNEVMGITVGSLRLGFWLNTAIHIYIGFIGWRCRSGLSKMLLGWDEDVTPVEKRIALAYPWYIIGVAIFIWLVVEVLVGMKRFDLVQDGQHYWIMLLLILTPTMDTLIRGLVKHLVPPMTGEGEIAERAYQSTKRSYIRIGRVILFSIVVLLIADIWEIPFENLASGEFGARFAAGLIEILIIAAVGYLVWEVVTLWINRKLAAEQTAAGFDLHAEEPGGGEGGGAGSSRSSTVLPLIRRVLQIAIIIMTVLIGLGNVGIDVTPLLAGAGIVGLAIGFGAQKLVADVVSGIFFLIDDAFRAGEFVDVEGTMGTVEKISMRSLQLRHHRGPVHTIPYGEIPKITNYSRDWVIMKLRFTVPFETDLNKVKKIFKKIGNDMMSVPEFADDFLQPFKSQGVLEVDDVGIVVRGKFMAKPGKQFVLRKEIYQRVQKEFEENGLQFARKEVRVKIDGADTSELTEEDMQAIAGAASDAAEKTDPLKTQQTGKSTGQHD